MVYTVYFCQMSRYRKKTKFRPAYRDIGTLKMVFGVVFMLDLLLLFGFSCQ